MCVALRLPDIIVVEDDPDHAHLICREIKKYVPQCDVSYSVDGLDAKERLKSGHVPFFIVTDIQMPRMDGLELIAWIRSEPHLRNVPIAVLSASENPHHHQRCDQLKVEGIFKKGSPLADLGKLINRFSGQSVVESGLHS